MILIYLPYLSIYSSYPASSVSSLMSPPTSGAGATDVVLKCCCEGLSAPLGLGWFWYFCNHVRGCSSGRR